MNVLRKTWLRCAIAVLAMIAGSQALAIAQSAPPKSPDTRTVAPPGALRARAVEAFHAGRHAEALDLAKAAAREGDADSAALAGHILLTSPRVTRDPAEAAIWLRMAASAGQTDALIELAQLARAEQGGVRRAEARGFYEAAITRGRADAAFALGEALARGELGPPDRQAAATAFERAAGLGDGQGAYLAALIYSEAAPFTSQAAKARRLMLLAAERGVVEAAGDYALMLLNGQGGGVDVREALKWLREGAEKDDATAQYLLAAALASGKEPGLAEPAAYREAYSWVLRSLAHSLPEDSPIRTAREALRTALEQRLAPGIQTAIRTEVARSARPAAAKPAPVTK